MSKTVRILTTSVKPHYDFDLVQLITDIAHPQWKNKNVIIEIIVKAGTGEQWVEENFGDD